MSIKVIITPEELESLDYNSLKVIFDTNEQKFANKRYLHDRYERYNDFLKVVNTSSDVDMDVYVAMEGQAIDIAVGYGIGKPVTYYDKSDDNYKLDTRGNIYNLAPSNFVSMIDSQKINDMVDSYLTTMVNNDESEHNVELFRECLISGSADEMVFTNEEAKIEFAVIYDDSIAFYDTSVKPKMIGFSRRIQYTSPINGSEQYSYELYTNNKSVLFDYEMNEISIGTVGSMLLKIPFIRYDISKSYIQDLIPMIRGYELVTNNTKKVMNYNDDALLVIKGFMFEDGATEEEVNKAIENIKTKGTMFLDSEDETKAEWLIKTVDDNANQNHKQNLKNDIYSLSGTFNPANDNMVYQNTLSLVFKLYGLEDKMSSYIKVLEKGLLERCKMIFYLQNVRDNTNYNSSNMGITFTRNLPTNTNEELNFINQARDFLPLEELYKMLSFVENPKSMVAKWKAWQLELQELEVEKAKITAKATESDMDPVLAREQYLNGNDD